MIGAMTEQWQGSLAPMARRIMLAARRSRRRARGRAWRVRTDHEAAADSARVFDQHQEHNRDALMAHPADSSTDYPGPR